MSVIVGAASITQSNEDLRQRVTADKFSEYLAGIHTLPMLNWKEVTTGTTQANTTTRVAVLAATGARAGDLLFFTSGSLNGKFVGIRKVATTDATLAFEMEELDAGFSYILLRVQPISATNPMSTSIVGSIPLPTGAATAALQSNVQETDATYGTFLRIGIPWFESGGPSSGIGPWPVLGDGMYASYPGVALVARQQSGGACVPLYADTTAPSSGADALGTRAVCYGIDGVTNRIIKVDSAGQVYVVGTVAATQSGTWTVSTTSANSGISDGRTTVTTAGTRVVLAASTACKKVDIQALASNTDVVVVGGTTCVAAIGTRRGVAINPGDTYTIEIDNLNDVNLDSVVSGEGVSYTYFT